MMQILRIIKNMSQIIPKAGMRDIKYVFFHCTAGPQNQTTQEIFNFWKKHNGWKNSGYHFDTNADGSLEQLVEIWNIANGVAGYNSNAIHFCYKGGIDSKGNPIDNRTDAQIETQIAFMHRMKELFPNAIHLGHRDISLDKNGNGILESWEWIKSCPAYDFRKWAIMIDENGVITPSRIVYKLHNPAIKNKTVEAIQYALGIRHDGYFGDNTDQAVRGFQANNKLTVDGVVGEKTALLLAKWIDPAQDYFNNYKGLLLDIRNK